MVTFKRPVEGKQIQVHNSGQKTTEKTTEKILRLMRENPHITNKELAEACGITEDGVYWNTKKLKENNIIRRVGGDKGGHWEIVD